MAEKVVQCTNGHYFDINKYEKCPHCGAYPIPEMEKDIDVYSSSGSKKEKKKGFSLFGHHKKGEEKTQIPNSMEILKGLSDFNQTSLTDDLNSEMHSDERDDNDFPKINKDSSTRDVWTHNTDQIDEENCENSGESNGNADSNFFDDIEPFDNKEDYDDSDTDEKEDNEESLADIVKKSSANSDGKSYGYFMAISRGKEEQCPKGISSEPVVGWLVCIQGPHIGESFNITSGRNFVGRNPENQIVISGDRSISRVKHAVIVYEPRKREFFLCEGDGKMLNYVNDEAVLDRTPIKKHDLIEMGSCKFLLIPLCGDDFSWEDYISKESD